MRRWTALLAAALTIGTGALGATGCGEDGAEPGAPEGASLVLDFTPNAAHSGIYTAGERGFYDDAGIDIEIRQPGASTDGPRLLAAGQVDFAVLDIHDLGLAREAGLDVIGVMPIVGRPLGSVIARADRGIEEPADLAGRKVGVTGLSSDDAILDTVLRSGGLTPDSVDRQSIGFNAVADLVAGNLDAATAFWNVEGVALRRNGTPVRIFRVDEFGAPPYPELILATSAETLAEDTGLVRRTVAATRRGYTVAAAEPARAAATLVGAIPALPREEIGAQMMVLAPDLAPRRFNRGVLEAWAKWDVRHGILRERPAVDKAFALP